MNIQEFRRNNQEVSISPLHYTDCGLDNIYLVNGFEWQQIGDERYLSIEDIDGLHAAIGLHIVLERKAPSGKELRFLRNELDMSQSELAKILGVSDQSVARWEKEQCDANGAAVFALRMIYVLSILPEKERNKLMKDILKKIKELNEDDELDDSVVMSYSGGFWVDRCAA